MPSIFKVDPSDVETFTVVTNPIRTYTSSSTEGVTGSVYLFARHSQTVKDVSPDSSFIDSSHDDADLASLLQTVQQVGKMVLNNPLLTGSFASGSYSFSGSWNLNTTASLGVSGSFATGSVISGTYYGNDPFVPAGEYLDTLTRVWFVPTASFTPDFSKPGPYISGSWSSGSFSSGSIIAGTYYPTGTFTPSGSFVPADVGFFTDSGEFAGPLTYILDQYLSGCTAQEQALRLQETLDVNRFSPPPVFNSNTLRKLAIKDMLNTYYRTSYLTAHWAYTNYNTLNFFTASTVPTSSVLLYPNTQGAISGVYTPLNSCSFDFYINPRYQPDEPNGEFRAGTIFHLSSTYALSLVSGTSQDVNGRVVGFRLQLQLSTSADIPPSWVYQDAAGAISVSGPSGSYTHVSASLIPSTELVFLSDDNVLQHNNWHHVVVRWGTDLINHGTGTFNVDGVDVGYFIVPSSSIAPSPFDLVQLGSASNIYQKFGPSTEQEEPAVLCIGNFYEGSNNSENLQADFFAADPALRDGLNVLDATPGIETPPSYSFNHPLSAELHDVAVRFCYLSDLDISVSTSVGPVFLDNTFAFYVPPFFTEFSPYRQFVNDHGGLLITPFEEANGASTQPFNVALSFGVAGHYINLENFVKDLAAEQFPLLHHLTGVALQGTTDLETANQFLYSQPFVAKRNLTILPCDDGLFVPSYQLLVSESLTNAIDDLGITNLSFINLDNMVMTGTSLFGAGFADDGTQPADKVNAFSNVQLGATTTSPFAPAGPATTNYINTVSSGSDVEAGAPLDVFQQTKDPSSNEVVIFDISNMFYGFRMSPGTLFLQDQDLLQSSLLGSNIFSGSNLIVSGSPSTSSLGPYQGYNGEGPVQITLADDGFGNVYRADCLTSQSTWNSVGNIYYDEGLIVLKSPHVYFFGQNAYTLNFRGEQHVHVMKIDVFAQNNQLNSSSNPNFKRVPINGYPNDPENDFVYITGINFHDTDMNVVMKTTLAQPISKRAGDRVMFKIKYDF